METKRTEENSLSLKEQEQNNLKRLSRLSLNPQCQQNHELQLEMMRLPECLIPETNVPSSTSRKPDMISIIEKQNEITSINAAISTKPSITTKMRH